MKRLPYVMLVIWVFTVWLRSARATDVQPTTFTGLALGGYTMGATVSAPGALDFRPGRTLWVVVDHQGSSSSGLATVVGSYSATSYHGWGLEFPYSYPGAVWLLSDVAEGMASTYLPALQNGPNTLALVWHATGPHATYLDVAVNGYVVPNALYAPAPGAPDATWATAIGSAASSLLTSTRHPYPGRVLAVALWPTEASPSQMSAGTFTRGSRYHLSPTVTDGSAFSVDLDCTGAAAPPSAVGSAGSSPLTFGVSGASLVAASETRYPRQFIDRYFADAPFAAIALDGGGNETTTRNPYAHVTILTDAPYVAAEAAATITWPNWAAGVGARLSGSAVGYALLTPSVYPAPTAGRLPATVAFALDGTGGVRAVDVSASMNDTNDVVSQPRLDYGSTVDAIRVPELRNDGVTATHTTWVTPPRPDHRLVVVGDYQLDGLQANTPVTAGVVPTLRAAYPSDGVTQLGGMSLAGTEWAKRSDSAAVTIRALDGRATNVLWVALGGLDYGGPTGATAPALQTAAQSYLTQVCYGAPGTRVYLQSPIQRVSPATEGANYLGNTLGDYRVALQNVAATCATGCSCAYVECAAGACVSSANLDPSTGISLLNAALAQLAAKIGGTLSAAGLL